MVGGDYVPRNLAALADDGRHVSIAFQRGAKAEIDMAQVMRRRLTLTGSTLRARSADFKAALADEINRTVWPRLSEGPWKPAMGQSFSLAEAVPAHTRPSDVTAKAWTVSGVLGWRRDPTKKN